MSKRSMLAWTAAAAWMAVIFILSHQPGAVSSGLSSGVTEFLLNLSEGIFKGLDTEINEIQFLVRKNAHFFAYLILGILLLNAIRKKGSLQLQDIILAIVASILYAVSDEIHQLFIDGRSGEVRDVLIDSAGAAIGIALYGAIYRLVDKTKNRNSANRTGKGIGK